MLDLTGFSLNRNPIAKVQIIFEISKGCPKVCAFFFMFFRKIKRPSFWRDFVPPFQVRCKSVTGPFQVRSQKRTQSEGTTDSQRRENKVTAALGRLEISPQKKLFCDNPTFLH